MHRAVGWIVAILATFHVVVAVLADSAGLPADNSQLFTIIVRSNMQCFAHNLTSFRELRLWVRLFSFLCRFFVDYLTKSFSERTRRLLD